MLVLLALLFVAVWQSNLTKTNRHINFHFVLKNPPRGTKGCPLHRGVMTIGIECEEMGGTSSGVEPNLALVVGRW